MRFIHRIHVQNGKTILLPTLYQIVLLPSADRQYFVYLHEGGKLTYSPQIVLLVSNLSEGFSCLSVRSYRDDVSITKNATKCIWRYRHESYAFATSLTTILENRVNVIPERKIFDSRRHRGYVTIAYRGIGRQKINYHLFKTIHSGPYYIFKTSDLRSDQLLMACNEETTILAWRRQVRPHISKSNAIMIIDRYRYCEVIVATWI